MSTASRASERGMALALAIFALVVVGALVAGAFLAGHLEQRTGRSTLYAEQAADAAEAGAAETLASWDALNLNALAPGTTAAFPTVPLAGRSAYRPTVSRLNGQIFLVQSLGTRVNAGGNTLARRTVGIVARLASLGSGPEAALTVGKPVEIEGNQVVVSGADSADAREGMACAPGAARPPTHIAASSSTVYSVFGDVSFDRLAAHAGVILPDTTISSALRPSLDATGRCDAGDKSNWGEPRRSSDSQMESCRRYFPIVYARGTRLGIAGGGRGQGILLVEGDLDISGRLRLPRARGGQGSRSDLRRAHADHRCADGRQLHGRQPESLGRSHHDSVLVVRVGGGARRRGVCRTDRSAELGAGVLGGYGYG